MHKGRFRTKLEFSKPALVFSGGATKAAAFHVGVCLALRDKGFSFVGGKAEQSAPLNACPYPRPRFHPHQIATYVGSSAGSLLVSLLSAGIPIESIINVFSGDPRFKIPGSFPEIPKVSYRDILSIHWPSASGVLKSLKRNPVLSKTVESIVLRNLRLPGLFSTKGLAKYLRKLLPTEYFHELKADLFVVGTQLDHSRKIIFGRFGTEKTFDEYCQYASNVRISDAVAASMSLPPLFAPYLIQHDGGKKRYYIDGEIRETLSTHVAKENGCDLLICSYTHQPYHYREDIGSLMYYGTPAIGIQAIYQAIEQKIYAAKKAHINKAIAIQTVREFFRENKYPQEQLDKLIQLLSERLDFNEKLHYVFVHPEAKDHQMFFGDHFTLSGEILQEVATIGYKRAMAELRRYELVPV
ncbi:MAG: patatin-like phospholipase family protein [Deltaproteobacteria bacterium]|nr:patatin-like phospholipase family protein [Deltaproteobacteria bacterium]